MDTVMGTRDKEINLVDKEILAQYTDMVEELGEIQERVARYQAEIAKIEKRLQEIEDGELVIDKVMGGEGGIQGFKIEGIPSSEYTKKKNLLLAKRLYLEDSMIRMSDMELKLTEMTNDVDKFIYSIEDSHIRRIIRYRFLDNLTWTQVADRMGGGNTDDSVKQAFHRYIKG